MCVGVGVYIPGGNSRNADQLLGSLTARTHVDQKVVLSITRARAVYSVCVLLLDAPGAPARSERRRARSPMNSSVSRSSCAWRTSSCSNSMLQSSTRIGTSAISDGDLHRGARTGVRRCTRRSVVLRNIRGQWQRTRVCVFVGLKAASTLRNLGSKPKHAYIHTWCVWS